MTSAVFSVILSTCRWPIGQAAKTPPSQGGIMGSIPVGVTNEIEKVNLFQSFLFVLKVVYLLIWVEFRSLLIFYCFWTFFIFKTFVQYFCTEICAEIFNLKIFVTIVINKIAVFKCFIFVQKSCFLSKCYSVFVQYL